MRHDAHSRRSFLASSAAFSAAALAGGGAAPRLARALAGASEALFAAAESGDEAKVRSLLDADPALLRSRDARGRSAFLVARLAGHESIGKLLLERGHEPDLAESAIIPDWPRVEALAKAMTDEEVDALHPVGGTALYAAALFGRTPTFRLTQFGARLDAAPKGGSGWTPLRAAMSGRDIDAAEAFAADALGNGGDANEKQRGNDTVLHGAAATGSADLVRLVLRKGGDPSARDERGKTPLDVAVERGHAAVAELLRNSASVPRDLPRSDPRSSRFAYDASGAPWKKPAPTRERQRTVNDIVSAAHTRFEVVKEMAAKYPDIVMGVSTGDEMTIEASAHMGATEMVRFFLDRGAPLSLPTCLTMGMLDRAKALLREAPERIRERGPHDFPLLWYPSIAGGSVEAAALLFEFGVDPKQEGALGVTALHRAASQDQADLVAFLVSKGCDKSAKTRRGGKTPLDVALANDARRAAEILR